MKNADHEEHGEDCPCHAVKSAYNRLIEHLQATDVPPAIGVSAMIEVIAFVAAYSGVDRAEAAETFEVMAGQLREAFAYAAEDRFGAPS